VSRVRGIAWSGVEAAASGAFSLVSAFVVARLIGPAEMGVGAAVASVHVLLWVGVNALFADAVAKGGDQPALHWKESGEWRSLTWNGYRDQVAAVTLALRSIGFGPGQFGLIMARNIPAHVIADLGIVHAGGTAISVYNTLAPEQVEYVANHSEATVAFVEDEGFLAKFLSIRSSTPHLKHLVLIRGSAPEGVLFWDSLVAEGKELDAKSPADFQASWKAVGPEDPVSLIYTSGTTGKPKGVLYSHRALVLHTLGQAAVQDLESPLSGDDLMERYHLPAGPWIGEIKSALKEEVVEGRLSPGDREQAWIIADRLMKDKTETGSGNQPSK